VERFALTKTWLSQTSGHGSGRHSGSASSVAAAAAIGMPTVSCVDADQLVLDVESVVNRATGVSPIPASHVPAGDDQRSHRHLEDDLQAVFVVPLLADLDERVLRQQRQ
jgi:hypothetical protein